MNEVTKDLRVKLVWLTVFRTVATSLLLAILLGRLMSRGNAQGLSREDSLSFGMVVGVYALTLVYGFLLRRNRISRAVAYGQVLADVVIASALVYLSGGLESPFTFTYLLAIVGASIVLQERGALVTALASTFAYGGMALAIYTSVLRLPTGSGVLPPARLAFSLLSNILAQFLIAALASYLSRQLSATGGRLSEREADLAKLDSLQRQILECMPSGLVTCEVDGRVTFVNRAGALILVVPEDAVATQSLVNIQSVLPGVMTFGPEGRRRELGIETSAGPRILGLTVSSLDGATGSLLIVFQDLTELRRVENELRRVDRLAALGTMSAQLAHEIRNPLAAMRGSAQMLAQGKQSETSTQRLSTILVREADRLGRLVENFLLFARPAPPQRVPVALDSLVEETVQMLQEDPMNCVKRLELDVQPIRLEADPDQLRQVLLNLMRNAFQAVGAAGRVRVSVERAEASARVQVWDSAGSIPPAALQRIFEPFFTTKSGGTGLGLSTALSIIRAHGGNIEVASSLEAGTGFTVILPMPSQESSVAYPGR